MQNLYDESRAYINNFLQIGYLKNDLKSVDDLLQRYIDINIYLKEDGTFRVLAVEKKTPDRKKAKSVQLYHFGARRIEKEYSSTIERLIKDFTKFSRYFQIQKKFSEIQKLYKDIEKTTNT